MEKRKKWISKYGFLLIFLAAVVICCARKNSYLETSIVSYPDSQISFSTDSVLEQTWQPHVKEITGISMPCEPKDTFYGRMKLELLTDDEKTVLLSEEIEKSFTKDQKETIAFSFEKIKLTLGERYRIRITFEESQKEAKLLVDSGLNYMGARVDQEEYNEAAALKITYVKNSRIFWLFSLGFPLLAFSFLFMVLWNRKWEEVIALSFIVSIIPMYICGLLERLTWGIGLTYLLSVSALVLAVYVYSKKQCDARSLVSPGLLLWVIGVAVILFSCEGIWLARWDEYSHWGLAVKDMFYYDSFAKHYDTTVMLPRYLPFTTLAEYLYVYLNGVFSEDIIYVAFQMMVLNGLLISTHIAQKRGKYIFPLTAGIFFLPVIFFEDISSCIYVDPVLAIFAAYVLICYFGEESSFFNWLRIFAGLFVLVTTKDMGFVIAGLLTMIMVADTIYQQWKDRKLVIKQFLLPVMSALSVIVVFMSWQVYLSIPYASSQGAKEVAGPVTGSVEASGVTLKGILDFFTKKGEGYQYFSIRNFMVKLFDAQAYTIGTIGASCMDIAILLLAATLILAYLGYWGKGKNKMVSQGIFTFIGLLCYCGVLGILYIFTFSENEAISAASYERYVGSFLCAQVLLFFYFVLRRLAEEEKKQKKSYALAIGIGVLILAALPVGNLIFTNREKSISENMKYGFSNMEEVLRSFSKRGETIYFVCSNSNGGSYFMFRNSASPVHAPYRQVNLAATEESALRQKDIYEREGITMIDKTIMTPEEWSRKLEECDYVFVMVADEGFKEDYKELFQSPETIGNGSFHKVIKENDEIKLRYIGSVGVKGYY